ncbi:hypothetical protein [Microbacterium sp. NPDC076895]|uniref:hypothetical protein n=1 Tax=Microbacterium sp. NPDC076895 TaxID=3154957 RepID=UPI003437EB54
MYQDQYGFWHNNSSDYVEHSIDRQAQAAALRTLAKLQKAGVVGGTPAPAQLKEPAAVPSVRPSHAEHRFGEPSPEEALRQLQSRGVPAAPNTVFINHQAPDEGSQK